MEVGYVACWRAAGAVDCVCRGLADPSSPVMAGFRRVASRRYTSEHSSSGGAQNFSGSPVTPDSPGRRDAGADFKGLHPGAKARHTISRRADEQQAMKERPVAYVQGSKGPLGSPKGLGGLRGRDVRAAAVAKVKTR
jgi:hypothetical protein